ncbi:MAG: sigma-70 family RNA polymerase sigma factor [Clostridia bacterium]|nr:sigma-70 family RNA polymerase sigma factor [Clostridia bacterium]
MNKREFSKLILRINQNERAFEKFYNYYFGKIVCVLSRKYGEDLAKDATQEFFLKLINNPHLANDVEHPNSWMFACCENLAKNKIAKDAKYKLISYEPQDKVVFPIRVEYIDLYDKLNELPEKERELIYKIYWKDYSQEEIAKEIGIKSGTLRQQHSRILKKLK